MGLIQFSVSEHVMYIYFYIKLIRPGHVVSFLYFEEFLELSKYDAVFHANIIHVPQHVVLLNNSMSTFRVKIL
jgi:hypothetical protein